MQKQKKRIKQKQIIPPFKKQLPLPYIQLTVSTWLKDSHGLYDYEAVENKCQKQTFHLANTSRIYRNNALMKTQIFEDTDTGSKAPDSIYITTAVLNRENQIFKIQAANISGVQPNQIIKKQYPDLFSNSFLVIRDLQIDEGIQGYPLTPGNVVRLGRVQYVVLEIRNQNKTQVFMQTSHLQLNTGNYKVIEPLTGSCKICLCDQSNQEDPLISPCLCKGTCEFIHVGCLKNWINSKVKKQVSDIVLSYNFSKFQCQICKAPFPKTITMIEGQVLQMIQIQKYNKPYLILQSVNNKQDKRQRNLHLIFSNQNQGQPLKVGRGHQCQMRVNDISVSRTHAQVRFYNNKFYIKDLKSKFGTLIKFKQEISIKSGVKLQYGRVCLEFTIKKQQPKLNQDAETNQQDESYY